MIRSTHILIILTLSAYFSITIPCYAQHASSTMSPRVLVVDAHPDDEGVYAAAIYKIVHDLHGTVDLVVITDGEAGYKYSTLAEPYYHLKLTDEKTGRKYLPGIRRKELENAGKILGLHHIYFFNQRDNRYTLNPHEVLDSNWNIPFVKSYLKQILVTGHYDYVFTMLPTDSTHGHHKAATILALTAVKDLPANIPHPIVLGGSGIDKGKQPAHFTGLTEFPITHISDGLPSYSFDRTQSFGFHHALNYKIIVNWDIAEHKSQGTEQLGMNQGDIEEYYYYDINPPEGRAKAKQLFDRLAINDYPELTYPGIK
ncbi:MAG TPA: PIG-L family deacetylase [Candidatus Kapabacteria bacterium]|nr:PIG-L family deacetylase [Candidatus Kapabacteria bacterium]